MFDPFDNKVVLFEEINFDSLSVFKVKKDRQVFYDEKDKLFYKIFVDGWEFADKVEEGIDSGYYDKIFVPNWCGIIKNNKGMNKGYITREFDEKNVLLANYPRKLSNKHTIKKLLRRHLTIKEVLFPYFRPSITHLLKILRLHFTRAIKSGYIWIELNSLHIWVDSTGYHIFDLDALRSLEWIFCIDKGDPEYIRKVINRKHLNRGLRELIHLHGLKFPFEIDVPEQIGPFWNALLNMNSLESSQGLNI